MPTSCCCPSRSPCKAEGGVPIIRTAAAPAYAARTHRARNFQVRSARKNWANGRGCAPKAVASSAFRVFVFELGLLERSREVRIWHLGAHMQVTA